MCRPVKIESIFHDSFFRWIKQLEKKHCPSCDRNRHQDNFKNSYIKTCNTCLAYRKKIYEKKVQESYGQIQV